MLYLAIDQHARQLTVNLRDEAGDVLLWRRVSTRWERVREFFAWLSRRASRYKTSGGCDRPPPATPKTGS